MILFHSHHAVDSSQTVQFLNGARQRGIDTSQMFVAESHGSIVYALLPIVSPGRTVLLLAPSAVPSAPAAAQTIEQVCRRFAAMDIQLAQVLIEPKCHAARQVFRDQGFDELAELLYLVGPVPRNPPPPQLPPEFTLTSYSPQTHAGFAAAILQSYRQSLDCPALNGVRDIEDIIQGHKATGQFDPKMWWLLKEKDQPRGVLLMSPIPHTDVIELVYLGLMPEARGRGLAGHMMDLAMHLAKQAARPRISLAVDSINNPALKLYYRAGLQRTMSKIAMVRNLARPGNAAQAG